MQEILKIDDIIDPDYRLIEKAVNILKKGGIIIFPTETYYGLGVDATLPDAIDRVFKVKKRKHSKPLLILISDRRQLRDWVSEIPYEARLLMDRFWPDGLTLVFEASKGVSDTLTAGTGKIGIRCSGQPLVRRIIERLGNPITATSANISGQESLSNPKHIPKALLEKVDLFLNGGKTEGVLPSTVVDATVEPIRIIRHGIISDEMVQECLMSKKTWESPIGN